MVYAITKWWLPWGMIQYVMEWWYKYKYRKVTYDTSYNVHFTKQLVVEVTSPSVILKFKLVTHLILRLLYFASKVICDRPRENHA
jgi:hypothetical protein